MTLNPQLSTAFAQGTAFTYQGRLNDGAGPANGIYDLRFAIYDSTNDPGALIAGPLTNSAVAVTDGLFAVTLDFGAGVINGADRWIEIAVRTNGAAGFTTLVPRQEVTAAPYALMAGNVVSANVARLDVPNTAVTATGVPVVTSGFITGANVVNGGSGYLTPPSVIVTDSTGSNAIVLANISGGAVVSFTVNNAGGGYSANAALTVGPPPPNNYQVFVSSNYFPNVNVFTNPANTFVGSYSGDGAGLTNLDAWRLGGNAGTTPGAQFIGTTDNQPLELRVNGSRALRLEPGTNGDPNVIGGAYNFAGPGVVGATIGGGGAAVFAGFPRTNEIFASYSTIGGGAGNEVHSDAALIAGGYLNLIDTNAGGSVIGGGGGNVIAPNSRTATIAGGDSSHISTNSDNATISGGQGNGIGVNSQFAVIAGGRSHSIGTNSFSSVIGGGSNNVVLNNSTDAIIPGGERNVATNLAFASGHRAKALHTGAFVWADSTEADFASTGANQFLIRASGGAGINTASPVGTLHVNGPIVIQGPALAPTSTASSNLINLMVGGGSSFVATNGNLNGISFYEGASSKSMSVGYDGSGGASQNALRIYGGTPLFTFEADGRMGIGTNTPQQALHVVGNILATGTVTGSSDRNAKQNFAPVDSREVLDKVAALPISRWSYKADGDVTHVGPMAQDFYAAFRVGMDDRHISMVDADGVALAAIQGLDQKTEVRSQKAEVRIQQSEIRIQKLEAENVELKARLEALEEHLNGHNRHPQE